MKLHLSRREWLMCLALLFVSLCNVPQYVLAQSAPGAPRQAATITGSVVDASGRPIANADVKLIGPSGGETQTNYQGLYTFTNVSLGTYSIVVTAAGYGTATRNDIVVAADTSVDVRYLNQTLGMRVIARASTTAQASINVTPASVSPLSPSDYAFQGVTSWRQILEQIPGVAATGNTYGGGDTNDIIPNGPFQPVTLSINGAQPYETATLLDGLPIQNVSFSGYPGTGADLGTIPLNAFDSAEVVRGPGADSPSILSSVGGTFVLHAPGPVTHNLFEFSYSDDPYGGFSSNAKVALALGRLSTTLTFGLNDSPGPRTGGTVDAAGIYELTKINGQSFSCPSVATQPGWLDFGCLIYRNPATIQPWYSAWEVVGLYCCTQFNTAWDVHNGSASLNYRIGSNITASFFYSGDLSRALQPGWGYPDIFVTPLAGYTGSIPPGAYNYLDASGYNSPAIQADSLSEEKITADLGRGVFRVVAMQNNSYGLQSLGYPPDQRYQIFGTLCMGTATGPTPPTPGSCAPGTTPTVFNGTSVFGQSYSLDYGAYNWRGRSNNRDLLFGYDTQVGSATNIGVSYLQEYYNYYYAVTDVGLLENYSAGEPDADSNTTHETRLHVDSELSDKLNLSFSWYFTEGTYHVPDPNYVQSLQHPSYWTDAVYPYNAPRLGLVWRASPDIAIRASTGGSFALPALYDLLGSNGSTSCGPTSCSVTLTNINLKPETSFGIDLGTDVRLNPTTALSLDFYGTNLYGQFFESSLVTGTFRGLPLTTTQYQNLAQTRMEGINLSIQHDVPHGIYWHGAFGLTRGYVVSVPAGFYNYHGVCEPVPSSALPNNCTNTAIVPGINFTGAGDDDLLAAVPYANGYGSLGYRWTPQKYVMLEADYFGKNNSYYEPPFVALNGYAGYPITRNVTLLATFQNLTCVYCGNFEYFTNYPTVIAPSIPGQVPWGLNSLPYGPRTVILTANVRY